MPATGMLLKATLVILVVGLVGYLIYTAVTPPNQWEFYEGEGEGTTRIAQSQGFEAEAQWTRAAGGGKILSGMYTGEVPAGRGILLDFETNLPIKLEVRIGPEAYSECDTRLSRATTLNQSYGSLRIESDAAGCRFLISADRPIEVDTSSTITWFARAQAPPEEVWMLRFSTRTPVPP